MLTGRSTSELVGKRCGRVLRAVAAAWSPRPSSYAPQTLIKMSKWLLLATLLAVLSVCDARAEYVFRANTFALAEDERLSWTASPAQHARQLVSDNLWTTMSTLSVQFGGVPYGNIVSYSDGIGFNKQDSTGKMFFYLTALDASATDLNANSSASVAISMAQEGVHACKMDVEDPTCWKLMITGHVVPVPADQRHYAEQVLFSKHPQMKYWPEKHGFLPYVMEIEKIILLDFYGGAKYVPVKEYYQVKL